MASIFVRIWLAFTLVLIIGGVLFFTSLERHVRPTAKQVVEDTLIDTSRVLASVSVKSLTAFSTHKPASLDALRRDLDAAFSHYQSAQTWNNRKHGLNFHIYLTDARGKVVYDSQHKALGKDFSKWNDVYLTLRGNYGARTTRSDPNDEASAVMYVAAPVLSEQGDILGVVSVGKPSSTLQPYLDATSHSMLKNALWVGIAALILAALVALWLRRSIHLVGSYAQSLGAETKKPYFFLGSELNALTKSIETMRDGLENKAYVENYVHTLTHELKSPITAIHASSELLGDALPAADREKFSQNIQTQCAKLENLVERLLLLAKLEQPSFRLQKQSLNVADLLIDLVDLYDSKIKNQNLDVNVHVNINHHIQADKFWLSQALKNVLDNAIRFSSGEIIITASMVASSQRSKITIANTGAAIPDYALPKVFERYFSLPKDALTSKGTGLGLTLVKEVVEKHGGQVEITNADDVGNGVSGVVVSMCL